MRKTKVRWAAMSCALLAAVAAGRTVSAQTDYSKVEITTNKLTSSFYTLDGAGGTIGVLAGPDGVLMVDSQFGPLTEKIVAAIKKVSDGRIRFLINTHVHPDHTGGNENLGKLGVTIVARETLRARLIKPNPGANGQPTPPMPAAGLPLITYDGPITFHMNGEDVRLVPVPVAHTDGDTMVLFPNNDVLMTGDFYRSVQYPNIDRSQGGSLKGMLDGLDLIVRTAGPATKIVPGHGPIVDRTVVAAARTLIVELRDKIAKMVQQGMTVEQVLAAKPAAEFDSRIKEPGTTADRFVGQLYAEIKAAPQVAAVQVNPTPGCSVPPAQLEANRKLVMSFFTTTGDARVALADTSYTQHNPAFKKRGEDKKVSDYEEFKNSFSSAALAAARAAAPPAAPATGPQPPAGNPFEVVTAECDIVTVVRKLYRQDPTAVAGKFYESFTFDTFRVKNGKLVEHWDAALIPDPRPAR